MLTSTDGQIAAVPMSDRYLKASRTRSAMLFQQTLLLPVPIPLRLGLTLVMGLLTLGNPDLHLRNSAVIEVQNQRHERHALALRIAP